MAYLDNDGLLYFWQQIKTKFAAASHTHAIADVDGLQAALDGIGAATNAKLATLAVGQDNIKQDAVGNHQLADDAVHTDNILDGAVTIDKINKDTQKELASGIAYATDATTAQALTAFGFNLTVITPKELYNHPAQPQADARSRLFWLDTNTGYLDSGVMMLSGNLQTQAITLYAKGYKSTASGILGVDESWTITALLTDADGVSY